MSINKETDR